MRALILVPAILATIATSLTSCYTDPEPGTITVTVLDAQDFRVSEAEVRFFQSGNGSGQIDVTRYTNTEGEVSYTHTDPGTGLALEVVLNVSATRGAATGQTVVRIVPGESSRETITIYE
jgi:hypothetical protein